MQPQTVTEVDRGLIAGARRRVLGVESLARRMAERFHLPKTFAKFIIVGGLGYVIYQGMFYALYDSPVFWFFPDKDTEAGLLLLTHPDIRLLIASVLGVETAIVFQFNAHERWTFRHRPRDGWIGARFVKFNLSSIVSPVIIVVTTNVLTPVFGLSAYVSNTIGVGLGFTWNWTLNTLVIWPHERQREETTS
jgi:putative flippase GtrA